MDILLFYTSLKPFLFATAYNMTGQVHEAEDIVQETFEDVLKSKNSDIVNAKSYLTRMVINKSIDRLATLKKQREQYPAVWLPEPYMTESADDHVDILSYAFLYLMEVLNPVERAVLILREAFDEEYDEIALLCEITPDNCRQILHRAKAKVNQAIASGRATKVQTNEQILQAFLNACLTQDTKQLSALLKEDVTLYSDGGGKVVAARKILTGISSVAKFLYGIVRKTFEQWSEARRVFVNNEPALLLPDEKGIYMVLIPHVEKGELAKLFIMRNPEKIFFKESVTK